jgi:hypothetical protein
MVQEVYSVCAAKEEGKGSAAGEVEEEESEFGNNFLCNLMIVGRSFDKVEGILGTFWDSWNFLRILGTF